MIRIARQVLEQNGFEPDVSHGDRAAGRTPIPADGVRDLRELPWSSIDNERVADLDQIESPSSCPTASIRMLARHRRRRRATSPKGSPIDQHADANTTSLYTGVAHVPDAARGAVDATARRCSRAASGSRWSPRWSCAPTARSTTPRPRSTSRASSNHAKLVYERRRRVARGSTAPRRSRRTRRIAEQLRLQDEAAQRLRDAAPRARRARARDDRGARRSRRTARSSTSRSQHKNRARELDRGPDDRRERRDRALPRAARAARRSAASCATPKRWDRIVELAAQLGTKLPPRARRARRSSDFLARSAARPTRRGSPICRSRS